MPLTAPRCFPVRQGENGDLTLDDLLCQPPEGLVVVRPGPCAEGPAPQPDGEAAQRLPGVSWAGEDGKS